MISELERRIYVDDHIILNELAYVTGEHKDEPVNFTFHNVKTDKDTVKKMRSYSFALNLARSRTRDGRYKNYEFYIERAEA